MKTFIGKKSKFSLEEREQIVKEYLSTNISRADLAKKYEIHAHSCISMWVAAYKKKHYSLPLQSPDHILEVKESMQKPKVKDKDEQIAELEQRVQALQAQLESEKLKRKDAEMHNMVLNTILDIAAEQGNDLRKKSGAKR